MTEILLAIKPVYAERIYSGEKKFEFRRKMPNRIPETILIYESAPVSMLTGMMECLGVLTLPKEALWNATAEKAGIDHEGFIRYFDGLEEANAYVIGKAWKFNEPIPLSRLGFTRPPLDFRYLPHSAIEMIEIAEGGR